jgi:hypothetical protein
VVPLDSVRVSRVRTYSGATREVMQFRLRDGCPLWFTFPRDSTTTQLCNSTMSGPTTPTRTNPRRFGLIPFRSPLLRESLLIYFPRGTEMFHFPRLSPPCLYIQQGVTPHYRCWVSPFGHPRVKGYSAPHRGLSQPFTPFIDSWCQGIHHAPLLS